jgi:predicted MFS family arabinose efflux permease
MDSAVPPQTATLRIVLIGLVSLAIAMGVGRFAFTPLLPLMQEEGLLRVADGGVLASVHFLGYWLGAVCAAKLPGTPRTGLRLSLIAVALSTLGMGLTESFAAWLALRAIAGAASAFILVLIGNFYIKHLAGIGRADLQGWVFSGVGAGMAAAGLGVLAIMSGGVGSAESWRLFGIATLVLAVAVCLRIGSEIPGARVGTRPRGAQRTPLDWNLVVAYGAAGMGYVIPATYLPVMARDSVPDPLVFGWSWPIFGLAAFASTLLAARLQKRFSNRGLWAASQGMMAVGLLLPALFPHIAAIVAAGVCVGGTFMIVTMAGIREAHRIAPPEDVMRHIAAMTAAFATGQMIGPLFASTLHDLTGSFSASLLATSAALAATALTLILNPPKMEVVRP